MKKSSFVIALCISAVISVLSSSSYAVDVSKKSLDSSEDQTATPSSEVAEQMFANEEPAEYTLPYPGMLSNNPLYPLKKVRDRLLDFLIRDPTKRVDFYLLMADKRYSMALIFAEGENYDRAYKIIEEGEIFYGEIAEEIQLAKDKNHIIPPDRIDTVKHAAKKHHEVATQLKNKSPEDYSEGYDKILEKIAINLSKIEEISR